MELIKFEWSNENAGWVCVNPPDEVDAAKVTSARERLSYTPTLVGFDVPGKTEYCLHLDRDCKLVAMSMAAWGCAPVNVDVVELPSTHDVIPLLLIATGVVPLVEPVNTSA